MSEQQSESRGSGNETIDTRNTADQDKRKRTNSEKHRKNVQGFKSGLVAYLHQGFAAQKKVMTVVLLYQNSEKTNALTKAARELFLPDIRYPAPMDWEVLDRFCAWLLKSNGEHAMKNMTTWLKYSSEQQQDSMQKWLCQLGAKSGEFGNYLRAIDMCKEPTAQERKARDKERAEKRA